ncbi:MAG: FmdB family zinc ribbon protein [Candidatus Sumerlaeota bacterium]
MPIYEYECQACQHITSIRESMKDAGTKEHECEECGSTKTVKIMSSFAPTVAAGKSPQMPSCPSGGGCASGKCPYA